MINKSTTNDPQRETTGISQTQKLRHLVEALMLLGVDLQNIQGECLKDASRLQATDKLDGSLRTRADLHSSERLKQLIAQLFPGEILVCEEDSAAQQLFVAKKDGVIWIVDPLDNTRGFARGAADYSILLTRVVSGVASDMLMLHPASNTLSRAHAGVGTFKNDIKLSVSVANAFSSARIVGVYTSPDVTNVKSPSIVESTEAFLAVAEGLVDVAIIRICGHKLWDVAFASLLLEEAGGRVTDEHGNQLDLTSLDVNQKWLVVSNGILHAEALNYLRNNMNSI